MACDASRHPQEEVQSLPRAPSSCVMAWQLGGDAALIANIIAIQTLLAAFTLPISVALAVGMKGWSL
ncbi:hypothetical protein [Pseudomonas syringae]|uniref:hypothetical protein n=1 Tax=Pseudomonas syringae TaxID=317 RepID=UPI00111259F5|nr:hypothetical protein [Pseudomonas syringae]